MGHFYDAMAITFYNKINVSDLVEMSQLDIMLIMSHQISSLEMVCIYWDVKKIIHASENFSHTGMN